MEKATKTKLMFAAIAAIIIAALVVSLLIRLNLALNGFIGNDECNYLSDAKLVLDGSVPFKDFFSRDPVLIYSLAWVGRGVLWDVNPIWAGRALSITLTLATGMMLYLIGEKLANKTTGVVAATLFLIDPFSILQNTQVMGAPLQQLFLSIAFYMSLQLEPASKFLCGAAAGLAVLSRTSALPFALLFPAIPLLKGMKGVSKQYNEAAALVAIGLMFTMVLPSMYFMSEAGVDKFMYSVFSSRTEQAAKIDLVAEGKAAVFSLITLVGQHHFSLILLILFLTLVAVSYFPNYEFDRFVIVANMLTFFVIFYMLAYNSIIEQISTGVYKDAVGSGVIVDAIINHPTFAMIFPIACCLLVLVFAHFADYLYSNKIRINQKYKLSLAHLEYTPDLSLFHLPIIWFMGTTLFYLAFSHLAWRDYYYVELLPPTALMAALTLNEILQSIQKRFDYRAAFVVLLLVAGLVTSTISTLTYEPGNVLSMEQARVVAAHIPRGSTVFTASTAYPLLADANLMLNITHPVFYKSYDDASLKKRGMPTRAEIVNYIRENDVKYVIVDPYTEYCYADILNTVLQGYSKTITVDTSTIYVAPDPGTCVDPFCPTIPSGVGATVIGEKQTAQSTPCPTGQKAVEVTCDCAKNTSTPCMVYCFRCVEEN